MELISIELKNFKQYRNQKIEFGPGLTGIIGKNGAGKSTIFDAILTAFFGLGTVPKDFLRNTLCMENETVNIVLILEKSAKTYRIIREYRGKALTAHAQFYINDVLKATSHGAVNEEVHKLIGMDRDSFSMSVFAGQKELGAISSVTGAPRRELIRRMTGMDRLDRVQQFVRTDRNIMKNELKGQENILLEEKEKNEIEKSIIENKKILDESDNLIKKTSNELEHANKAYSEAKKVFSELESAKNNFIRKDRILAGKYESLKSNKTSTDESIERLEKLKKEKNDLLALKPQEEMFHKLLLKKEKMDIESRVHIRNEQINLRIESIDKDKSEKIKLKKSITEEISKLENLKKESGILIAKRDNSAKSVKHKRYELEKLNNEKGLLEGIVNDRLKNLELIKQAGKESACPTCFRPLQEAYDSAIQKLNSELETYTGKELKNNTLSIDKVREEIQNVEIDAKESENNFNSISKEISRLEEKEKQLKELNLDIQKKETEINKLSNDQGKIKNDSYDKPAHDALNVEIQKLTLFHEKFIRNTRIVEDIPSIEKKLIQLENEKNLIVNEIKKLEEEIKLIPYSEDKYSEALSKREKNESIRDSIKIRLESEEKIKTISTIKLGELETKINEDKKRRVETEKLRMKILKLDKLDIHLDGFKKIALDRVRPVIAEHAGELFNNLTRGRYQTIFLDENFDFYIIDEGQMFPISRFSGGEIDLANLCLRIAISRAVSDMSGAENAGFLAFDEIFGSQDNERRGEILTAFHRLQEMYRQIFIISHIDELKADFPRIMEISRTIDGSEVRIING